MVKEAVRIPITKESFLAQMQNALGRDFDPLESRGIDRLLDTHPITEIQGYFLDVVATAQKKDLPLADYLSYRKKPLRIHLAISQRISKDQQRAYRVEDAIVERLFEDDRQSRDERFSDIDPPY